MKGSEQWGRKNNLNSYKRMIKDNLGKRMRKFPDILY